MKYIYTSLTLAFCILFGLSPFFSKASETEVICIKTSNFNKETLKQEILADFEKFKKLDSIRIRREAKFALGSITNISYDSVTIKEMILSDSSEFSSGNIVVANFHPIIVRCSVQYNCKITFAVNKNTSTLPADPSDSAYWGHALFNTPDELSDKTNGSFSQKFVWSNDYKLKKSFASTSKRPAIDGDCFTSQITLTIPNIYSGLETFKWAYDTDKWTSTGKTGSSIILLLKPNNSSLIQSLVHYTASDCQGVEKTSNKTIRINNTPAPTITPSENCISTNFSGTKTASVTTPVGTDDINFTWSYKKNDATQTSHLGGGTSCSFHIDNYNNYTLYVQSYGGCNSSSSSIRIDRKLGSNISVQVEENNNCIEDGDIIHFVTNPRLPNIPLTWHYPKGTLIGNPIYPNDYKTFKIEKASGIVGEGRSVSISSAACPSNILQGDPLISTNINVRDKIELRARIDNGEELNMFDSVFVGTKVIFEATPHELVRECKVSLVEAIRYPFVSEIIPVVDPTYPPVIVYPVEPPPVIVYPSYKCSYTALSPSSLYRVSISTSTCKGSFITQYLLFSSRRHSVIDPPIGPPHVGEGEL